MPLVHQALDLFLHLDKHLNEYASGHQVGVYVLLAVIVFCETGLVVWPFLPGDSLLFAVGALAAASGSPISLPMMMGLLCLAANCGDVVNYVAGRRIGPRIFSAESSWLLNKRHLEDAHRFYEKHGRKTIILARFVPIIRTFAPFVAGIGQMPFARFIGFSISGGILWVVALSMAGFYFNQIEFVRTHFQFVVLAIIVISMLPMIVHAVKARSAKRDLLYSGKSTSGLIMLIYGVLGSILSIGILVFVVSHSPNIGLDQAVMAGPNASFISREFYPWFLFAGWATLFVSGLLVIGGIISMAVGARRFPMASEENLKEQASPAK